MVFTVGNTCYIMENLGIERMGFCTACGHEINNHVGIYNPQIGYMYVGKCCASILCKPNTPQINPVSGTEYLDTTGREFVILDFEIFQTLHKIGHGRDYQRGIIDCMIINQFICNICGYMKDHYEKTGVWELSKKQYDCIKKYL